MLVHDMNCYLPSKVNGFGGVFWLLVVELINGVETGTQVTARVGCWPVGVCKEVTGRKFCWQEEQMLVYWMRQLAMLG